MADLLDFDSWWSSTNNQNFFSGRAINVEDLKQVAEEAWKSARVASCHAVKFDDGKKIYDQGWNDGIEALERMIKFALPNILKSRGRS